MREVPDFPEPGVLFRDISPVLADPAAFRVLTDALVAGLPAGTDAVVGIEARGFILGAAVAYAAGLGLATVRKPGKLPVVRHRVSYSLEYGTATLELPEDTIRSGERVVIVDDVLATGGTVAATQELVEHAGGVVAGVSVILELAALKARDRLPGLDITALLTA
ncbi:adenine phosphoribosyltransferase [Kutzneria buriramensis]|uniref:adenine phosphoribosyltransferase n=1 Tax=Kutzneria buriramensis TaxID=1045776 RepID=UPI000E239721